VTGLLLALAASPPVPAAPAGHAILTGLVEDTAGLLLGGSVILLTPVGAPEEARTTTAGADGRYLFPGLAPGLYRVVAMKPGYATTVARVNTFLKSTLDFALRPVEIEDPEIARSSAWILRLPPRDVLRETGLAVPSDETPPQPADAAGVLPGQALLDAPVMNLPIDGEIQQWFSSDSPVTSSDDLVTDSGGNSTAVRLAVQLGDRVNLKVAGERERADAQVLTGPDYSERLSGADCVGLSLGYDLGQVSRLDMQASYDRQSLLLAGEGDGLAPLSDRENVTRLYRTSWSTAVGERGNLDVSALYIDSEARGLTEEDLGLDSVVNRLWRAGGQYRMSLGDAHVLTVGLRARMLELDGEEVFGEVAIPAGFRSPLSLAGPQPPGWALHLHGNEEWALNPALAVHLGVDYHRSLSSIEVSHLVPQAGASIRPTPQTLIRAMVSYLADSTADTARPDTALAVSSSAESREPFGYELALERQTKKGTLIVFSSSASPIAYGYAEEGDVLVALTERPLYVSDGQAQSREVGLEVQRRFGWLTARAGSAWGRIDGRYAASLPGEILGEMHDGSLRYVKSSISGLLEPLGTEMRIEVRTLRDDPGGTAGAEQIRLSGLSFLVAQELPFIKLGSTRWRVLVAYQNNSGSVSGLDGNGEALAAGRRALLTAENRLSGGVSVQF
jgi:hypothetical protein